MPSWTFSTDPPFLFAAAYVADVTLRSFPPRSAQPFAIVDGGHQTAARSYSQVKEPTHLAEVLLERSRLALPERPCGKVDHFA